MPLIKSNIVVLQRPPISNYIKNCKHIKEVVKILNVPLVLSLHFNSYTKPAKGAEALLVTTSSTLDDRLGDKITDLLNEKLGIKERGNDGVKLLTVGERAYKMHKYVKAAGSVLVTIEPCFANYRTPDAEAIFEHEDRYSSILAEAINEILKTDLY